MQGREDMGESSQGGQPGHGQPGYVAPGGTVNTGISITGGTVSGIVAGGQGAQVTVNQGMPADERLARIERLLQELEAGADVLGAEDAERMQDNIGRLRGELHHERPDKGWVAQLLQRLTTLAAPAATMLDLVTQVKDLVH
jgi:hypothetical protein